MCLFDLRFMKLNQTLINEIYGNTYKHFLKTKIDMIPQQQFISKFFQSTAIIMYNTTKNRSQARQIKFDNF